MDSVTILREAIDELNLQTKLIRKQQRIVHDNTFYREWVKNVLPSMISVLERAYGAAKLGIPDSHIEEEISLAYNICGKENSLDARKQDSRLNKIK